MTKEKSSKVILRGVPDFDAAERKTRNLAESWWARKRSDGMLHKWVEEASQHLETMSGRVEVLEPILKLES